VHLLRGNHEDSTTCAQFGFRAEIESKFEGEGEESPAGWILKVCTDEVYSSWRLRMPRRK
jgi:hypothetical protein